MIFYNKKTVKSTKQPNDNKNISPYKSPTILKEVGLIYY